MKTGRVGFPDAPRKVSIDARYFVAEAPPNTATVDSLTGQSECGSLQQVPFFAETLLDSQQVPSLSQTGAPAEASWHSGQSAESDFIIFESGQPPHDEPVSKYR